MSKQPHINENDLERLLRELQLEIRDEEMNEREANFVLQQDYPVTVDGEKEKALLKRLYKKPGGFGAKGWITVLAAGALLLTLWYVKRTDIRQNLTASEKYPEKKLFNNTAGKKPETDTGAGGIKLAVDYIRVADTFGRPKSPLPVVADTVLLNTSTGPVSVTLAPTPAIPYLTAKDRLRYPQVKRQMIQKLLNNDKGLYTRVPASKIDYSGKPLVIDGFTIRNVGITNLEYKTFLADLLMKATAGNYLDARVDEEGWARNGYAELANYFTNEKYNDFPVVNMTRQGAESFCSWLQEEVQFYLLENKLKPKVLTVRLPFTEEWIFAAREGYAKIAFEKGYNTIYDETEGLVDHSFTNRVELVKKRTKRVDTLYTQFTTNHYGWNEKEITDFFGQAFNYYSSLPADTIYVDRMKVLGKIGRVSELVIQQKPDKLWLVGLSWKNKAEYLKLEHEFNTYHSSPFVGFRVMVIDPTAPAYKNPFW